MDENTHKKKLFAINGQQFLSIFVPLTLFSILLFPSYLKQERIYQLNFFDQPLFYLNSFLFYAILWTMVLIVLRLQKSTLSEYGLVPLKKTDFFSALFTLLLMFTGTILISIAITLYSKISHSPEPKTVTILLEQKKYLIAVLFFCLAVGYTEELFFRSYMLTSFEKGGLPKWGAILLSTLLFSAGHLYEGIFGTILVFFLGMVLSIQYFNKRSIHSVAIAHAAYNFLVIFMSIQIDRPI